MIIWILEKQLSDVWHLCGAHSTLAHALRAATGGTAVEGAA